MLEDENGNWSSETEADASTRETTQIYPSITDTQPTHDEGAVTLSQSQSIPPPVLEDEDPLGTQLFPPTPIANPDPVETMGVVLPGFPFCPLLRTAVFRFISPGATASTVCDLLKNAAICNVALFYSAFSKMLLSEFRECLERDLQSLGSNIDRGKIFTQLIILRSAFESKFIRNQYDPSKRVKLELAAHPGVLFQPSAICARMLGNTAQASNYRENIIVPRAGPTSSENENSCSPPQRHEGVKHFHANKRKGAALAQPPAQTVGRLAPLRGGPLVPVCPGDVSTQNLLECPVSAEAFRVASFFRDVSDTFRFCGHAAYPLSDTANFVILSIRNRARSLNTLRRVAEFTLQFYKFASEREPPFPVSGDESLLAVTLWMQGLLVRGATIPHFGRYSLRVFGEALGVRFPLEHPAVRNAAVPARGRKIKTDPVVETEFVMALERAAGNRGNSYGYRLYCALFTLLAFSSLRFGDTTQVETLFNSGTALCGTGVNNKDRSGELMQWATPLSGLLGNVNWSKPIFDF